MDNFFKNARAIKNKARRLRKEYFESGGFFTDTSNLIKYGFSGPRFAERIWIDPSNCVYALNLLQTVGLCGRRSSGFVYKGDWPYKEVISIGKVPKIRFCIDHWVHGVPWKQTGVYDYMLDLIETKGKPDGCKSIEDIRNRYQVLDSIFLEIKAAGRLKTRKEIVNGSFREKGGILIHLGPNGQTFFGGGGVHRFAIAFILGIPMPAQIGIVHVDALKSLKKMRKEIKSSPHSTRPIKCYKG